MARNEYHDDGDDEAAGAPDTYWRRRAITLALGLGLLGILAWGFSGGGVKSTGSTAPLPATALGTAVPGAPPGSPISAGSSPGSAAKASVSPSATPRPAQSGTAAQSATAAPSATSATAAPSVAAAASHQHQQPSPSQSPSPADNGCAPGSVVLSLFTDRPSYGAQDFPRFNVYAVSTTSNGCTFNPGQLQVVVLSSGRIIWDSTDCVRPMGRGDRAPAGPVTPLARGVPVQDELIWNRDITLPGCEILAVAAHPGNYAVQARTTTVQSPIRYFKLTA